MSLVRHWYPSPNYSTGGSTKRLLVLHTTEGWGDSPSGMYDCAIYFQGNVGASSDVIIDSFHPGHICEGVAPYNNAWTQCGFNSQTASAAEQCGYAAWSRNEWLNNRMSLLENAAAWLAEESHRFGIPLTELSSSQSQDGYSKGVTYHSRLGPDGCGHSDPGSGYPLAEVLEMARGGSIGGTPPPSGTGEDHVTIPGKPGNWLKLSTEFMAANGVKAQMGVGTAGDVYYITKAFSAGADWRGPRKLA